MYILFVFQPAKAGNELAQVRGSPRKLKRAEFEHNGVSRPKTSSTTTSSPRIKDSMVSVNHMGKATGNATPINAKKRLAVNVPSQVLRPQTSPEVATIKNKATTNRPQYRSRASSSKRKACNDTQINSDQLTGKHLQEISEEKPKEVVKESSKEHNMPEVLVVTEPRLGFKNTFSDEAWPSISNFGQGFGEVENTGRSPYVDKQSKEPSPPSRNNRYGNGIKTRLAKLFNKGNACMEEPKVIEPQKYQGREQAPYLPQAVNDHHMGSTRYYQCTNLQIS